MSASITSPRYRRSGPATRSCQAWGLPSIPRRCALLCRRRRPGQGRGSLRDAGARLNTAAACGRSPRRAGWAQSPTTGDPGDPTELHEDRLWTQFPANLAAEFGVTMLLRTGPDGRCRRPTNRAGKEDHVDIGRRKALKRWRWAAAASLPAAAGSSKPASSTIKNSIFGGKGQVADGARPVHRDQDDLDSSPAFVG